MSSPNTDITCRVNLLGRLAVPKAIRRQMGIQQGDVFDIIPSEDGILFRKHADISIAAELENAAEYISNSHTFSFATPDALSDFLSNANFYQEAERAVRERQSIFEGYGQDMRARFLWNEYLNFAYEW